MKKCILFLFISLFSLSFFSCSEKEFSVSDEIEISTSKESLDNHYDKLNGLVLRINEERLLQKVQKKFPESNVPFIDKRVSKTKTTFDLPGKKGETYSLKVNLSMKYDETRAGEAAAILEFYKQLYREELTKLKVTLKDPKLVSNN